MFRQLVYLGVVALVIAGGAARADVIEPKCTSCAGSDDTFTNMAASSGVQVAHPGDPSFSFVGTVADSSTLLSFFDLALAKALYVTSTDNQDAFTSEGISGQSVNPPVKETGILLLMGSGIIGVALLSRKLVV